LLGLLAQQDRERIDLLARGATRHPYPDRVRRPFAFEQARHDQLFQCIECLGIAEKIGDTDEKVAKQSIDLAGVLTKAVGVARKRRNLQDLHAAFDPAIERAGLVAAEVVTGLIGRMAQIARRIVSACSSLSTSLSRMSKLRT
jgi:hypothetical protein